MLSDFCESVHLPYQFLQPVPQTHTSRASRAKKNSCYSLKLFCSGMLSRCGRTQQPPGTYRSLNCCSSFCFGFAAFHRLSFRKNLSIAKRAVQGWRSLARSLSVSVSVCHPLSLFLPVSPCLPVSLCLSFSCLSLYLSLSLTCSLRLPLCPALSASPHFATPLPLDTLNSLNPTADVLVDANDAVVCEVRQ